MSNKEIAKSFLRMAAAGDVRTAYDKFIAPHFIHHNQYFKGDRESLMKAMEESSQTNPNKVLNIKQIFEDGNTVIAHSHVVRQNPDEPGIAVVHIMRFQDGLIVEMWDIGQVISKDSPNKNGAF